MHYSRRHHIGAKSFLLKPNYSEKQQLIRQSHFSLFGSLFTYSYIQVLNFRTDNFLQPMQMKPISKLMLPTRNTDAAAGENDVRMSWASFEVVCNNIS